MPAAAVASLTPATSGMSGTSVGASGETAEDIDGFRQRDGGKRSVSSSLSLWEWMQFHPELSSPRKRGSIPTLFSRDPRYRPRARFRHHAVWVPAFAGTTPDVRRR